MDKLKRLYEDLRIHQEELEHQNRELREAHQQLEASRDRYANLYDFAPVCYVDFDDKGRIRNINLTGAALIGVERIRLVDTPFVAFVVPDDRRTFLNHISECKNSKRKTVTEVRLAIKNADPIHALLHTLPSQDPEIDQTLYRTAITDISQRKRAEEQLRAAVIALKTSEEQSRSLVEHLPVGVLIVQKGRVVFWNPETERLFGPLPRNPDFRKLLEVHPDYGEKSEHLVSTFLSEEAVTQNFDFRFRPRGSDGEKNTFRWVLCHTSPIEHRGRKATLVHVMDVSRAKEMEHLLMVQEKLASLGQMSAGIAHEIRNPLSGINIYLSTLEQVCDQYDRGLDAKGRETIRTIVEQIKSASHEIASVIRRVMDFSKVGPPRLEPTDVNHAVESAERLSLVTLRRGGVTFSKSLDPHLPKAYADSRLIEQVLVNLIDNAVHAMDHREGPRQIEIASFASGEWIVVTISDSGPGIPIPLQEKIFDPFFTTRKEGYGIGLSFSYRVITDHGGSLQVGTGKWGGAEFRIELPVAKEILPR